MCYKKHIFYTVIDCNNNEYYCHWNKIEICNKQDAVEKDKQKETEVTNL